MKISQSLIKMVSKHDHCPKQVYYSFVEGKELFEPSESMLLGRYFESELLGACRGGEKQEPRYLKGGNIANPFQDCLDLVEFARGVFNNLGIDLEAHDTEVQYDVESETLKGAIDLVAKDIQGEGMALYDVKWTGTKEDDRWNGWADPEEKEDAIIQAAHYILTMYETTTDWMPFYFLVFGRDFWVKIIKYEFTEDGIEQHKKRISYTASVIKEYVKNDYKGNGSLNKCIQCPFFEECPDKASLPKIETVTI